MDNSEPLVRFGIAVILVLSLFIIIPFVRKGKDIVSAWNAILFGLILFAGIGSIEVYFTPTFPWKHLQWFQPTQKEVQWYMLATSVFIVVLLCSYYYNRLAITFAQKSLREWPEVTSSMTIFILACCGAILLSSALLQRVTFLGPLTFNLALTAAPAASTFSTANWFRNRKNVVWLGLFLAVFAGAALYSMVVSAGRRLLLSVFLGPCLYFYWTEMRYWRRVSIVLTLGLGCACLLAVSLIYNTFRYSSSTNPGEVRTARSILEKFAESRARGNFTEVFFKAPLTYLGQGAGQNALIVERFISQGTLTPVPVNSLWFLVSYPIPREVWQNKPNVLGVIVTHQAAGLPSTNWGLGVAGQGAYEGGIPTLVLYAVLIAFGIRFMDEPLKLQPTNLFLIYMHASVLPHVIAIPRGDMGYMTMQVGQCVLFAVLLGFVCRSIFGKGRPRLATANQLPANSYGTYQEMPRSRYYN